MTADHPTREERYAAGAAEALAHVELLAEEWAAGVRGDITGDDIREALRGES